MQTSMAISQSDLTDFSTSTGICKITEKKELQDQKKSEGSLFLEYSYTLEETKIFEARGFSRETNTVIPPLTHVFCLAKARDKMLITAAKDTEKYCGWVDNDALLEAGDGGNILSGSSLAPCGQIKPVNLGQFCEKSEDLGSEQDGCRLEAVKASVINTKFVTDNTTAISSDGNRAIKTVDIPVYSRPESDQILQTVKIFSIFEVFDVGLNPKTNELMLLVGMNANDLKGWININSGKIWYSNLSTFFSRDGEGDVKRFPIGEPSNETIAKRPDRNSISFVSQSDHLKYPVLFDFRKSDSSTPKRIRPHLRISFIGKLCEEDDGSMCSVSGQKEDAFEVNLDSADILFLIDGTKSMQKYFKIVSRAVENFTEKYVGNPEYRFGLAIYGDFKSRNRQKLGDPIDFAIPYPLETNYGDVFDDISNTKLFLKDVLKDKAEPTNAAIFEAVRSAKWADQRLRYIIHLADHGDRVPPSSKLIITLKNNNIFYIPIAVEGEAVIQESAAFVDHSQRIYRQHVTDSGLPMAVKPTVTYGGQINDYEAISSALVGALNVGQEAANSVENDALGDVITDRSSLEPGFAALTEAARDLYSLGTEGVSDTIAATGYIESVKFSQDDPNWDYFVALTRSEMDKLTKNMETVCYTLGSSGDDSNVVISSVSQMIETLAGDRIGPENLGAYFRDRTSIPLISQTILGDRIMGLVEAIQTGKDLTEYKKSFCKTSALTTLMLENKRLPKPVPGGSLIWNGDDFDTTDEQDFDWVYTDEFKRDTVFLPLAYLP